MEDNEAKELSRGFWIGESLIPKQMNNLGILWRKRVKIWSRHLNPVDGPRKNLQRFGLA